ncbi:DUF4136 domain-containing protein [Ramlibacter sp. PS4R-6]|uniref:DUF4136 domain-containing protein n=1 Tax=Ramlibacter sp. PS4R-6 TaxID=3133438 RepID=UPI0030A74741
MKSKRIASWIAVATLALLAGCAGTYTVDNTVQSFSQIPTLPQPATYRFERLPSQQDVNQPQLEAMADPALNAAGLRRDDATPRFSVQISARTERTVSPFADPWDRFGWGFGAWGRRRHFGMGVGFGYPSSEPSWFHREVNVVVRDLSNNRVVYESRAISDGPYFDGAKVFPAMFTAALQGFPNPPAGPRQVNIQIPS